MGNYIARSVLSKYGCPFEKYNLFWICLSIISAILLSFLICNSIEHSLTLVAGLCFLFIISKRPEVGLLLLVVFLSSIVFLEKVPSIPLGFGTLYIPDIVLIFLLIMMITKKFKGNSIYVEVNYVNIFMILFYIACVVSLFYAFFVQGVEYSLCFGRFRKLSYYLIYFVIVHLINSRKQFNFIVMGMAFVGIVVGMSMMIQAVLGDSIVLMPGRLESFRTFDNNAQSIRILPPGQTLILVLFLISGSVIAWSEVIKGRFILYLVFVFSGIAVLLTYNRSYWVASFIVFMILFVIGSHKCRIRILLKIIIPWLLIVFSVAVFSLASPSGLVGQYFDSIEVRISSLFMGAELYESGSLENRRLETEEAIESVLRHPILGIGLGNSYRQIHDPHSSLSETYIHNGYLWVLVKMGLVGLLPLFGLCFMSIFTTFRNAFRCQDSYFGSLLIGIALCFLAIILINIVNPMYLQQGSIVVISILMGMAEVINRLAISENLQEGQG